MPSKKRFSAQLPIQREKRQIKPRKKVVSEQFSGKWALEDKKKLLRALKKYDNLDINKIQAEFLPHRSGVEIEHFLKRMRLKSYLQPVIQKEKVPIELWVEMAEDLTSSVNDYSCEIAEVFSNIENCEVHDQKRYAVDPNWHLIYNYLGMHLRGEEPPEVGQIEAGILLDLLDVLTRHLRSLDVSNQRKLMARKYALLSARISRRNGQKAFELVRHALEEDLLLPTDGNAASSSSAAGNGQKVSQSSSAEPTSSTSACIRQNTTTTGTVDSSVNACPGTSASGGSQGSLAATASSAAPSASQLDVTLKSRLAPLYSINPFCIPIKYLNPKKLAPCANDILPVTPNPIPTSATT